MQTGHISLDRSACLKIDKTGTYLAHLPDSFCHTDEFFNFTANPCTIPGLTVLASVDERSYDGGLMGEQHPVVWCRHVGTNKAPVFYCALGHFDHFYNGLGPDTVASFIKTGLSFCAGL